MTLSFAKRMNGMKASEIREILKVTENPSIISFAGGLPAPELFPVEELARVTDALLAGEGARALQYSSTEGYMPLRSHIARRMNRLLKTSVDEKQLLITSGSQQALDLIGKIFLDEGDEVLLERPSYLGAIQALRAYEPRFVEVDTDSEGMLPDALEAVLKASTRRKLIYVIPDFQNPTGRSWSLERRKALAELSVKYGAVVVEDNPYGELRFQGEACPSVLALGGSENLIHLGTFSKTLCPGLRVGWIAASGAVLEKLVQVKQGADLHTSTFNQMQIAALLNSFDLDAHVSRIQKVYGERRDVMLEAMEEYFPREIQYTRPEGGLFTWVELPEGVNGRHLFQKAVEAGVAFVPGGSFYACTPRENTFRMNYSNMPEPRIREGIQRLSQALAAMLK